MVGAVEPVVYVVDDDQSIREALEDLLTSVGLRVETFGSIQAFLDREPSDAPSCLVLDVRMPGQSGMDFQRRMSESGERIPTIMITGHGDIAMAVEAMKNGAIEFLAKPFRDQDLLDAIQLGLERDRTRRSQSADISELGERWRSLSTGERDVMALVVQGLLNKQIAAELDVSEITVKVRRGRVMRKMQARTLADLVRMSDKIEH